MNKDELLYMCSNLSEAIEELRKDSDSRDLILKDRNTIYEIERLDQLLQSLQWFNNKGEEIEHQESKAESASAKTLEIKCPQCNYIFFRIN